MHTAVPPITSGPARPLSKSARALAWGEWLLIVLLGIRLVHWLSLPEHTQQSDFRIFYAAASRLIHGLSPYGFAVRPGMFFVQPPWFALFLGPLALLPLDWARACWMTMNLGLLVSIVFMAARLVNVSLGLRRTALVALALTLWPPVQDGLSLGQSSLLVTAAAVATLLAAERNRMWLAGGLMVIASIKPQLVFLLGLGLTIKNWRRLRSIEVPVAFAAVTAAALALCLIFTTAWVGDLIHARPHTTDYWGVTVSIRTLFALLFGRRPALEALYWIIFVCSSALVLARWTRPDTSFTRLGALIFPATLLLTPYGQNHDYVLLILPLILLASSICQASPLKRFILLVIMFFLLWAIGGFGSDTAWLSSLMERPSVWNWLRRLIGEDALDTLYYNVKWNTRFVIMLLPLGFLWILARSRYGTTAEIQA